LVLGVVLGQGEEVFEEFGLVALLLEQVLFVLEYHSLARYTVVHLKVIVRL
jgi:hypothetical protein